MISIRNNALFYSQYLHQNCLHHPLKTVHIHLIDMVAVAASNDVEVRNRYRSANFH